eukprot:CAMPEP_0182588588 /NCGR_PEP_ID=MMETSP1324-20130603/67557_1 /TAXON_ID=236786 /ORGANISM="Florenciella sp., Strain RCC1587" /LENGTH=36 /DNA_ID= /DNA_START= /DNA_END= /DNA_ORIENTATION=
MTTFMAPSASAASPRMPVPAPKSSTRALARPSNLSR